MNTTYTAITIHRPTDSACMRDPRGCYERKEIFSVVYPTNAKTPEAIAEEMYHITNAPDEMLTPMQLSVLKFFRFKRLYSVSCGDVIQVGDVYLLCDSCGWVTKTSA